MFREERRSERRYPLVTEESAAGKWIPLEHWRSKERPAALSAGAGTPTRRPPDSSNVWAGVSVS